MMDTPQHIRIWAEYQQARDRGDLEAAEKLHRQWRDLLATPTRTDAPEPAMDQTEDDGIDWDNVASEAAAMLELNQGPSTEWQGQQPEDQDD